MCSAAWQSVWLTTVKWNKILAPTTWASASKIVQLIARQPGSKGIGSMAVAPTYWFMTNAHRKGGVARQSRPLNWRQKPRVNNGNRNCNWPSADHHHTAGIKIPNAIPKSPPSGTLREKSVPVNMIHWDIIIETRTEICDLSLSRIVLLTLAR